MSAYHGHVEAVLTETVRRRDRKLAPFWVWLGTSFWLHAIILFVGFLVGGATRWGDGMRPGPGGVPVEFQVAGDSSADALQGSTAPEAGEVGAAPIPQAQPEEQAPPEVPDQPSQEQLRPRHRRTQGNTPEATGQQQASAEGEGVTAAEQGTALEPSGTDANQTAGGGQGGDATHAILGAAGLLGTGAASSLLGNGDCTDSIVGVWRAQKFRGEDRSWVRFTLHVEREGDRLRGTITSRIWQGSPTNPVPGECTAFGSDQTWLMGADGHLDGENVSFEGRTLRLIREDCPSRGNQYAIDHFRGTVRGDALTVVNNDGAYDVDEPYTFRRVACE